MVEWKGFGNSRPLTVGGLFVLILLITCSGFAQLNIGDNTQINLNGSIGFGYGGTFGNTIGSGHGTSVNGLGSLTGYYYHPNFISFNLLPYYNRSQTNSISQSILDSSGVSGAVNFFTGSRFPGSVFYGKDFSSTGQFGLPGVGSLSTEGSSQSYGFTWSALFPDMPTLTASFSSRTSDSTVLGTSADSSSSTKDFTLNSTYTLAGFGLSGFYSRRNYSARFPDFVGGASFNGIGSNSFGASATHRLPMSGSFWSSYTRTTYSNAGSGRGDNKNDNADVGVSIAPWKRLTLSSDLRFMNNLISLVAQEVVPPGETAPILYNDQTAKALVSTNNAYLSLGHGFMLVGNATHREQWYDGQQFSDNQFGGTLSYRYSRPLFGLLFFNFGLVDNANKNGNTGLGFTGNVGFTRRTGAWDFSADAGYSQNVQTLYSIYSTSNYTYGGYVRRRLNLNTYWSAAGRETHSALVQNEGDGNRAETFSSGLNWRRYGFNATYSQSKGSSVLTATGELIPTPIGNVFTNDIVTVDGHSMTLSLSSTPLKHMIATAYYSKVKSNTTSLFNSIYSINDGSRFNGRIEYKLRKLSFIGNITRTNQVISASNPNGAIVNSYSFTVSRWFNVF